MNYLLLLETSSKNCSVAIANEHAVLHHRSASAEHFVHAEQLHGMMHELIEESQLKWEQIAAVAVGKGPGSYTGLRIGVSAAKGLCFSLNIPLIAIETTALLAGYAAQQHSDAEAIVPMIDARRMEVYTAQFDVSGKRMTRDEAVIVDSTTFASLAPEKLVLVGDGAEKCRELLDPRVRILSVLPSADMMHSLAIQAFNDKKFEDLAYFEPFYLKDYIPGTSVKSVL
jgi:tRNA threonylcarbamoyladenosine biosynthesis protein TsaB